jgi:hypothetical protein
MTNQYVQPGSQEPLSYGEHDQKSFNEMLQELRVLQQGSQILVGFLILLPFSEGFLKIAAFEKWVYIIAFLSSVITLICFSAPAAQHRLERPLKQRVKFKLQSNRIIVAGTAALSIALIATTQLVSSEVLGNQWAAIATLFIGLLIMVIWWVIPLSQKGKNRR